MAAAAGAGAEAAPRFSTPDFVLNADTGVYENGDSAGTLDQGTSTDAFIVDGAGGDDTITTGSGDDVIRAGAGADTVNAGAGDDQIFMVGQTGSAAYTDGQLDTHVSTSPVISASLVNGHSGDVAAGDRIDGGDGTDTLYTLGNLDLSGVEISNVENLRSDGDVTIDIAQLSSNGGSLASLTLDVMGSDGVLRLTNDSGTPTRVDISVLSGLAGVQQIDLGANVIVEIDGESELSSASVVRLTGSGTIDVTGANVGGSDLANYAVADGVTVLAGGDVDANKLGAATDVEAPVFSGSLPRLQRMPPIPQSRAWAALMIMWV